MKKLSILILLILILAGLSAQTSMENFKYGAPISSIKNEWHSLDLTPEILGNTKYNLSDIRIFGISSIGDSIQAPYFINIKSQDVNQVNFNLPIINNYKNDKGNYFIIENILNETINTLNCNLPAVNFNYNVQLDGSNDKSEWFTITESERLVAYQKEGVRFDQKTINFQNSKFKYFRILFKDEKQVTLKNVRSKKWESDDVLKSYPIKLTSQTEDKQLKKSIIECELPNHLPIANLSFELDENLDYFRPILIETYQDSFKNDTGWKYKYYPIHRGIISSKYNGNFNLKNVYGKHLRITIYNDDNIPLKVKSINAGGYLHQLIVRIPDNELKYFMVYGNEKISAPKYDILSFKNSVPSPLQAISLGESFLINKNGIKTGEKDLSKTWLWIAMGLVIAILGFFSLKMIQNSPKKNN